VPFLKRECERLSRDYFIQHFILMVDVWHRDKQWLAFMAKEHPRIHLVFIPGGCTGVAQPCDIFIQRPFKLAVLKQFGSWLMEKVQQTENFTEYWQHLSVITLKNEGCKWIWQAWKELKQLQEMMGKGWKSIGIWPQCNEEVFYLRSRLLWTERKYDITKVHVPWRSLRQVPVLAEEESKEASPEEALESLKLQQESCFVDAGEDEEEEAESTMAECINDESIAELLQAEEDNAGE
jgi:hypothetical protein